MNNAQFIEQFVIESGLSIGIYHAKIDRLSKRWLKAVLDGIESESDTDVFINRIPHVVEIDVVDNEVDLRVITKKEYIDRYGNERYEDD